LLDRTPHQQFLPPRIEKARQRLKAMIWKVSDRLLAVQMSDPTRHETTHGDLDQLRFEQAPPIPFSWGKRFDQCWWKVAVPADPAPHEHPVKYLAWRDQGEATAYFDGKVVAGIDPGHTMLALPQKLARDGGELLIESICCRTGIWVPGAGQGISESGSLFEGAYLATRHDEAWDAYFDAEVLLDLAVEIHKKEFPIHSDLPSTFGYRMPIERINPLFRRIVDGLDKAVDALDHEGPAAMATLTKQLIKDLPADAVSMAATLTGHAHIDLVWLWPERTGEFKAVHSLANVLDVQQRYPEMVFGYTQPASFEAVKRRAPELFDRVMDATQQGRFEPVGAMYVESDTQLACGEALVRAFELGQAGFRSYRPDGKGSPVVWLPDVFGYSAVLPTIMAGFGVPYFYTTKMHWSSATKMPFSSFRWAGMDGSEVVAHLSWNFYNLEGKVAEVLEPVEQHRQAAVHHETLIPIGYGDGGGGPNDEMCERVRRLENLSGLPRCQWGTIEGFFDRLAENRAELPLWQGEMYLEGHRGVHTTQAELKRYFREVERCLQVREAAACLLQQSAGERTEHAWRRIVFAQFHDYITGTSVPEVYAEHIPELRQLAIQLNQDTQDAFRSAASDEASASLCWFNPLPVDRNIEIDQRMVRLPALSITPESDLVPLELPPATFEESDESVALDNGRVRAVFNGNGEIEKLAVDGVDLALKSPAGRLFTFPDHPAKYDAWDIDRATLSNGRPVDSPATVSIQKRDTHAPVLVFERRFGQASTLKIHYQLLPGETVLRVKIDLDLQDPQLLLKWCAQTNYSGSNARFGAPFGSTLRPQKQGPLANDAMFESPGSRWAAVSDDTEAEGLMLVTEAKYGFGCSNGLLHLSLIRSPLHTGHRGEEGGNASANTGQECSDLGKHTIHFAVGLYSAQSPREYLPAMLADTLYAPAIHTKAVPTNTGMLRLEGGDSLIPAWCKPQPSDSSESSYILRLHETLGRRGTAKLHLSHGFKSKAVDLNNHLIKELPENHEGFEIDFEPYQIISVLIYQI